MQRIISLCTVMLLLGGCSAAIKYNAVVEKPLTSDTSRVVIYRPNAFIGKAMTPPIYVDGAIVGYSIAGTRFNVDLKEGEHLFAIPSATYSTSATIVGGAVGAIVAGHKYEIGDGIKFNVEKNKKVCIKNEVGFNMTGAFEVGIVDCVTNSGDILSTDLIGFD